MRLALNGLIDLTNPDALDPLEVELNYWTDSKNAIYHILKALDTIPGFKEARERNDIKTMADLYREHVIRYKSKGTAKYREGGQVAFFYEVGGLSGLINKSQDYLLKINSPALLLRLALRNLINDENPDALKSHEVERREPKSGPGPTPAAILPIQRFLARYDIPYSPFLQAPTLEELFKVGAPFAIKYALGLLGISLSGGIFGSFSLVLGIFAAVFVAPHIFNEPFPAPFSVNPEKEAKNLLDGKPVRVTSYAGQGFSFHYQTPFERDSIGRNAFTIIARDSTGRDIGYIDCHGNEVYTAFYDHDNLKSRYGLYVLPEYRHNNIGDALTLLAMAVAKEQGNSFFILGCRSAEGRHVGERIGFFRNPARAGKREYIFDFGPLPDIAINRNDGVPISRQKLYWNWFWRVFSAPIITAVLGICIALPLANHPYYATGFSMSAHLAVNVGVLLYNAYRIKKRDGITFWDAVKNELRNPQGRFGNYASAFFTRGFSYVGDERPPSESRAFFEQGSKYLQKGDYTKAIICFDKAIEGNPKYSEAYNSRGVAYDRLNKANEALKDYSKAIEFDPGYDRAYYNRGILYLWQKEYEKAIADLDVAIKLNPKHVRAYVGRGKAHQTIGESRDESEEFQKALADYSRAIAADPKGTNLRTCAEAHLCRGAIMLSKKLGKQEDAVQDLYKAIVLDPQYSLDVMKILMTHKISLEFFNLPGEGDYGVSGTWFPGKFYQKVIAPLETPLSAVLGYAAAMLLSSFYDMPPLEMRWLAVFLIPAIFLLCHLPRAIAESLYYKQYQRIGSVFNRSVLLLTIATLAASFTVLFFDKMPSIAFIAFAILTIAHLHINNMEKSEEKGFLRHKQFTLGTLLLAFLYSTFFISAYTTMKYREIRNIMGNLNNVSERLDIRNKGPKTSEPAFGIDPMEEGVRRDYYYAKLAIALSRPFGEPDEANPERLYFRIKGGNEEAVRVRLQDGRSILYLVTKTAGLEPNSEDSSLPIKPVKPVDESFEDASKRCKGWLTDNNPKKRLEAVIVLSEVGSTGYLQDLINVLKNDASDAVRARSAAALGCNPYNKLQDAIPQLITSLKDKSDLVRAASARAISSVVGPLPENNSMRVAAIKALTELIKYSIDRNLSDDQFYPAREAGLSLEKIIGRLETERIIKKIREEKTEREKKSETQSKEAEDIGRVTQILEKYIKDDYNKKVTALYQAGDPGWLKYGQAVVAQMLREIFALQIPEVEQYKKELEEKLAKGVLKPEDGLNGVFGVLAQIFERHGKYLEWSNWGDVQVELNGVPPVQGLTLANIDNKQTYRENVFGKEVEYTELILGEEEIPHIIWAFSGNTMERKSSIISGTNTICHFRKEHEAEGKQIWDTYHEKGAVEESGADSLKDRIAFNMAMARKLMSIAWQRELQVMDRDEFAKVFGKKSMAASRAHEVVHLRLQGTGYPDDELLPELYEGIKCEDIRHVVAEFFTWRLDPKGPYCEAADKFFAFAKTYILDHPTEFSTIDVQNLPGDEYLFKQFDRVTPEQFKAIFRALIDNLAAKIDKEEFGNRGAGTMRHLGVMPALPALMAQGSINGPSNRYGTVSALMVGAAIIACACVLKWFFAETPAKTKGPVKIKKQPPSVNSETGTIGTIDTIVMVFNIIVLSAITLFAMSYITDIGQSTTQWMMQYRLVQWITANPWAIISVGPALLLPQSLLNLMRSRETNNTVKKLISVFIIIGVAGLILYVSGIGGQVIRKLSACLFGCAGVLAMVKIGKEKHPALQPKSARSMIYWNATMGVPKKDRTMQNDNVWKWADGWIKEKTNQLQEAGLKVDKPKYIITYVLDQSEALHIYLNEGGDVFTTPPGYTTLSIGSDITHDTQDARSCIALQGVNTDLGLVFQTHMGIAIGQSPHIVIPDLIRRVINELLKAGCKPDKIRELLPKTKLRAVGGIGYGSEEAVKATRILLQDCILGHLDPKHDKLGYIGLNAKASLTASRVVHDISWSPERDTGAVALRRGAHHGITLVSVTAVIIAAGLLIFNFVLPFANGIVNNYLYFATADIRAALPWLAYAGFGAFAMARSGRSKTATDQEILEALRDIFTQYRGRLGKSLDPEWLHNEIMQRLNGVAISIDELDRRMLDMLGNACYFGYSLSGYVFTEIVIKKRGFKKIIAKTAKKAPADNGPLSQSPDVNVKFPGGPFVMLCIPAMFVLFPKITAIFNDLRVAYNTWQYNHDPSAKIDEELLAVAQRFEERLKADKTGPWEITWTESPLVLKDVDTNTHTIRLSIGWIAASGRADKARRKGHFVAMTDTIIKNIHSLSQPVKLHEWRPLIIGIEKEKDKDESITKERKKTVEAILGAEADVRTVDDEGSLGLVAGDGKATCVFIAKDIDVKLIKAADICAIKLANDYEGIFTMSAMDEDARLEIARLIEKLVPEIKDMEPAEIFAFVQNKLQTDPEFGRQLNRVRELVTAHITKLNGYSLYNNPAICKEGIATEKRVGVAITEEVALNNPTLAKEVEDVIEAGGDVSFVYGGTLTESHAEKILAEARCTPENIAKVRLVSKYKDGNKLTLKELEAEITKGLPQGITIDNVGLVTAPGEYAAEDKPESMHVLQVEKKAIKGRQVLLTMNTAKVMFRILKLMSKGGEMTIAADAEIPGLSYDSETKRFTYLPPMIPVNAGEEVETYRSAMLLLSSAA